MWKELNRSGSSERTLELLLRLGVAGCFIGHGAFGVIGKIGWLPYFAVAGIGEEWAFRLMPIVGTLDILVGVLALLAPRPILLVYAAVWATWTALLRPLAGESFFETLERAGNYGVPIAMLIFAGASLRPGAAWLRTMEFRPLDADRRNRVMLALRATIVMLLAGHGGLALLGKPLLAAHAAAVGLPDGALALVGAFELVLAAAIAVRPVSGVLLFILMWKLGTEALYPITGDPFWEFVERAGSYIAPLALWTMVRAGAPAGQRSHARLAVTSVLALVCSVAVGAMLGASPLETGQESLTLERARSGGLVFMCRHAITDRSRGDQRQVDFDDPSTQRVLSESGRAQARRLGRVLANQGVLVGEVFSSPYSRTAESARLAFGRTDIEPALFGGGDAKSQRVLSLLTDPPRTGANRVLMTHQGNMYRVLPEMDRGSIREGDCVAVSPSTLR